MGNEDLRTRMECLELAVQSNGNNDCGTILTSAGSFYKFVTNSNNKENK